MITIKHLFGLITLSVAFVSTVYTSTVYGHDGHDHSHWSAEPLHYAFYICLAIMIAVVMFCMVRLLTVDAADRQFAHKHNTSS